ncbi:MAG: lamin tail domain-containing protein, partial [Polyangiaceae bacterium]|nr:lamin tail domain-containing protein [Polyangiaceae bacterium]
MSGPSRSWLLLAFIAGCLEPPGKTPPIHPPSIDETDGGTRRIELHVEDARGERWPLEGVPRRPRFVVDGATSPAERDAIFLFEGPPDSHLAGDLARAPLLAANRARAVKCAVHETAGSTWLVPEAPLVLGRHYTIGIAAWAVDARGESRGAAELVEARVAPSAAGAVVLETWPASGSYGVPNTIPFLAIRFDDSIEGIDGVELLGPDGAPLEVSLMRRPCDELALGPGECVSLIPSAPLPAQTAFALAVGEGTVDRTGASVGPFIAEFRTGSASEIAPPPALGNLVCGIDEATLPGACALAFETRVHLRARALAPVRAVLTALGRRVAAAAPRGELELALDPLPPGSSFTASLTILGLDGQETSVDWNIGTPESLPRVFITEVRANPSGSEPAQEYVEVHNASDAAIDLSGFQISDDRARVGDTIAGPAVVPGRG